MEKGINLLRVKEEVSERAIKFKRFLQVGSILLLIFYILILGGVFSFWFIQQRESQIVREKVKQAEAKITELQKIESLQLVLKERLQSLTSIFGKEEINYKDVLSQLERLTPSGVDLESIDLAKDGGITISGSAENSLSLGEFLVNLTDPEEENFESVALSSISREENGIFKFSLALLLKAS